MPQLTFYGRKTVPPKIRKDHWRPMATVHFVDSELGQLAHRKLREFKFLRDYSWRDLPGSELAEKQSRQDWLMDQKARSVADLAATIEMINGIILLRHDRVCMREQSAREGPWKRVVTAAARASVEAPRIMRLLVQLREKEKQELDPQKKKALAATMTMLRIRRNFVLRSELAVQSFERQVEDILSSKTQAELNNDAKFLPEAEIQPTLSLEERARKVASDIQRVKEHRIAAKAAKEEKIEAARSKKKGQSTSKRDRKADHAEQLHELSRSSKETPPPIHPFPSLSEQTSTAGPNTSGAKTLLLSRHWQLLVARAVAYAVDAEPQPLEEDDLKRGFAVQVFWDNPVDRKHANYWPENTEHLWMGPRMKRLQYVASLPEDMLRTVRQWRGGVEALAANEGMDEHVRIAGGSGDGTGGSEETLEGNESGDKAEAKPSLLSGLVSRFRRQKSAVPSSA
jgi:hypothetical protein